MKTFPFHIAAAKNIARLFTLTRGDEVVAFTDADLDITLGSPSVTWTSEPGAISSRAEYYTDGTVSNCTVLINRRLGGPLSDADVKFGRYDGYPFSIDLVDTGNAGLGASNIFSGQVGSTTVNEFGQINISVVGPLAVLRGNVSEKYSAMCRADLFDERCKVDSTLYKASTVVASLTGPQEFTVASSPFPDSRATDDTWYVLGTAIVQSGRYTGQPIVIRDWDHATLTLSTFVVVTTMLEVGTSVDLYPGCDKTASTCFNKFNDIINMRAEPFAPGRDAVQAVAGLT